MSKRTNRLTKRIFLQVIRPLQKFVCLESTSGLLLFICTVAALTLGNSSFHQVYFEFLNIEISLGIEGALLKKTVLHWINDGLMCLFFFVIGLEIKRELLVGELAGLRRAILPVIAAIGGMIVPALIYILFNKGTDAVAGWGIPMATDIAFSLGVLTLFGSRLPNQLKIFLAAFAIVDDLGAVLVIAFFYGSNIQWFFVIAAAFIFLILLSVNWTGIRNLLVYSILGLFLWFAVLESGIHATIAGVLLAITVPVRPGIKIKDIYGRIQLLLIRLKKKNIESSKEALSQDEQSIVQTIEISCHEAEAPLQRFENKLHPWVTYLIMPIFAFANAGVIVDNRTGSLFDAPVALGIILGLVLGKQIGITLFSWIAVKVKLAALPSGVAWKHLYGVSWLGGIGFTMSLFITTLSFNQEILLNQGKLAILIASLIAGVVGSAVLYVSSKKQ